MNEIPAGMSIETVYLVEVPYTTDASERRPAVRAEHLARIASLIRDGRVLEAGGCSDLSKAVLLVRAADDAAALALVDEDVYTRSGVWHEPTARAFGRVDAGPVR